MNKIQILDDNNEIMLNEDMVAAFTVYIKDEKMGIETFLASDDTMKTSFLVFSTIASLANFAYPSNNDELLNEDEDDTLIRLAIRRGLEYVSKHLEKTNSKIKIIVPEVTFNDNDDIDDNNGRLTLHD